MKIMHMKYWPTLSRLARNFLGSAVIAAAVFLLIAPSASSGADKLKFPRPTGAVNDFAGVIPADSKARMEALSTEILDKTGTAVVVATMQSLDGQNPDMYATDLYAAWGIGKKGEDKGVLIFVAVQERKVRIETGYGVEGILPDGLVGSIRDQYLVPYLKTGDYGQGLFKGMLAIGTVIARDAGVTIGEGYQLKRPVQQRRQQGGSVLGLLIFFAMLLFLTMTPLGRALLAALFISGLFGGRGGGSGGGGFDGFGGGGFGGFGGGMSGGGGASGDF
jgi:uncharacterized protein